MDVGSKPRSKAFVSMDSLWYEEERLATFIDWQVPFISCTELAKEGFYYLRTKDHCACAFCRGIIGAWEEGDTPRGEHKRHFPHCPFVQGRVTPNVPISQGSILARLSRDITSDVLTKGEDVCGSKPHKKEDIAAVERVVKTSNPELSMANLGFRQYCGPKRKEYLTTESRLNSFKCWPEKVKQTPLELAEAGFYYCGLSDHVRCFHCGNGLRNWEPQDNPWDEHARWFPDCHYVLLKKGIEFVDKVRRERPPYIPTRNKPSSPGPSSSTGMTNDLSNEEIDKLLELEIMKHVLDMGFSKNAVRNALRKRVLETGQPFYSVESCIDVVLMFMDEERKEVISGCEDITSQARKIAALEASNARGTSSNASLTAPSSETSGVGVSNTRGTSSNASSMTSSETAGLADLPMLPNCNIYIPPQTLPPLPVSRASPPLRSSTPTSNVEASSSAMEASSPTVEASSPSMQTGSSTVQTGSSTVQTGSSTMQTGSSTVQTGSSTVQTGSSTMEASSSTMEAGSQAMEVEEPSENMEQTSSSSSEVTISSSPNTISTSMSTRSEPTPEPNRTTNQTSNVVTMELPSEVLPLISEADDAMEEAEKLLAPTSSSSSSSSSTSSSSSSSSSTSSSTSTSSSSTSSGSFSVSSASTSGVSSNESSSDSSLEFIQESNLPLKECKKLGVPKEDLAEELERIRENRMCKVCMDKEMDVVFLPCTHMVACSSCVVALAACPICRREIQLAFKPIIS